MTPIYQQHIDIIAQRWPLLVPALENATFEHLEFDVLEKGAMTLTVNGVQLSSAYDPLEEAFQYRSITSGNDYHIWGLGMGNVPSLLIQDTNAQSIKLYVYNLSLTKLVLSLVPQSWLTDPRVELILVEEESPELGHYLSFLSTTNCIIINADRVISRKSHQWLFFRFQDRLMMPTVNSHHVNRDTEYQAIEAVNKPLLKRIQSSDTYLRYQVKDAVCIGAGPSLEHHIEELKRLYAQPDRPRFIAAATACKCLLANGIKPDVVFAVDIDTPISYIPFEIARNTILVFASRMPAEVFQNWHGEKYYTHLYNDGYDRFSQQLPIKYRAYSFGSVIHPIIHFTLLQGAMRISLIGCDFGFPNEKMHASMENRADDHNATMTEQVMNGYGELIKTSPTYRMFGSGVENLIATYSDTKFYNWSRIGAKIIGTEYLDLESVYGI